MYIALARKYRPRNFGEVAVQSHVSNTLRGAIARDRVAHGYLLCGPRGVGKTTLARVLAMALNCERRREDGEPCGECSSCQRIWAGSASLDVVEIDAASNRGVDDARELRERAMYAPSTETHHKVYIVDEAHMLTREAWNALLKVLEEPPPRVVFVFATTEPQKIAQLAAPVLSRLQRFDLRRIGVSDMRARLEYVLRSENVKADEDALMLIARAADGSLRDALSLTDQVLAMGEGALTVQRVRDALGLVPEDEFLAMLDLVADRRAADVFPEVARLADAGVDLAGFLTGFADVLRSVLAVALGGTAPDASERLEKALEERAKRFSPGELLRMLTLIAETETSFRKSAQQQMLLEALLVRFALMDRTVELEQVLSALGGAAGAGESPRGGGDGGAGGGTGGGAGGGGEPTRPAGGGEVRAPRESGAGAGATAAVRRESTLPATQAPPPGPPFDDTPADARWTASAAPLATVERARAPSYEPPGALNRGVEFALAPPLELNRLTERWDEVVARLRDEGRQMLAASLEHAMPVSVSARGEITLETDADFDMSERALTASSGDVLAAVARYFSGATRLLLRPAAQVAEHGASRRLTSEEMQRDRLARLRRRDPSLDAAVDLLDLELLD